MEKLMRQTNWVVITGAPCSGKTVVICRLAELGYLVVHETARAYIDAEIAKGRTVEQIRADEHAFERRILYEKLKIEAALSPEAHVFLDRGVPDSIAYFKSAGLDTTEPVRKSTLYRYKKIFLFDRLAFKKDAVRAEDDDEAARLDLLLEQSYRELGYPIVRVPFFSIQKRTEFILNHL